MAAMDASEMALEITRLKMRLAICQRLLLQTVLFSPQAISTASLRENQQQTVRQLDEIASGLELGFLQSANKKMTDAERALHADEIREIVEQMKSFVNSVKS